MIAAPRSGSGKTTVTLGLLRAFRRRGVDVIGLKSGPDYIDPAFHAAASGREGVNLDSWAMTPKLLAALAAQAAGQASSRSAKPRWASSTAFRREAGRSGASADVAAALGMPVLLVLDVSGQAQSAAAIVKGCATYDARLSVAGVIVNRVGSERHRRLVVDAIEAIGDPGRGQFSRVTTKSRCRSAISASCRRVKRRRWRRGWRRSPTLLRRMSIAAASLRWPASLTFAFPAPERAALRPPGQRIALARDAAFSFIYPHLVQGWRAAGAEIVPFSPLADEPPPDDCDVCWLPGGYPELHAGRLAAASRFRDGLRRFAETAPCTASAGATWRWAKASSTLQA